MSEVFCLTDENGRILPPAVQATVLARYSRSPLSAKELLKEVNEARANDFQERVFINWGHNSVAELATIPICFEGISIVASKFIESWQRPGYSEKSTRYQKFSRDSFIVPPDAPDTMKQFVERIYNAYDSLYPAVLEKCRNLIPGNTPESAVKARAFDNIRYLLPAGTGTNVAVVINFRDVRSVISALRGHSNPEFRLIGDQLHDASSVMSPVLIKRTEPNYFHLSVRSVGELPKSYDPEHPSWGVEIHKPFLLPDNQLEQKSFESSVADFHGMSWSAFCKHMEGRPNKTEVPDVFKTIKISFDVIMDYGAFRDLQRHRRCEQYVEPLTTNYGYIIPADIKDTELEPQYQKAMELVQLYDDDRVVHDPNLMQYMVPLGYLHRSIFQMDLKELYYITELRTPIQGHISYRRVVYKMFELARRRWPNLMQWCRAVSPGEESLHL